MKNLKEKIKETLVDILRPPNYTLQAENRQLTQSSGLPTPAQAASGSCRSLGSWRCLGPTHFQMTKVTY